MSTEFETIADNCAPRNALFCCRSPICLNNSPQLVPVKNNPMESQCQNKSKIYPVCVPDLSDAGVYTNLMTQARKYSDNNGENYQHSIIDMSGGSHPPKLHQINKSQSAQDIRHYGVSLRRVTPPKCTVSVKKNENPMMNVVLRKVFMLNVYVQCAFQHPTNIELRFQLNTYSSIIKADNLHKSFHY